MSKFKEDISTMGQPSSEEERRGLKQDLIKVALGNEDLQLDNQSDEQLDDLMLKTLKKGENMDNTLDNIYESLNCVGANEEDFVEAIRVHLNVKLDEAKEIYGDYLQEKKQRKYDKLEESLLLLDLLQQGIDGDEMPPAGSFEGSYKKILYLLDKMGFVFEEHYYDEPCESISAKKDGKCYDIELNKYSDGKYELRFDNIHEVPCDLEESLVPPVENTVDETINAEGYQAKDQNV